VTAEAVVVVVVAVGGAVAEDVLVAEFAGGA
jgi:hypothetical protein